MTLKVPSNHQRNIKQALKVWILSLSMNVGHAFAADPGPKPQAPSPAKPTASPSVQIAPAKDPVSIVFQAQWKLTSQLLKSLIEDRPDNNLLIAPNSLSQSMGLVTLGSKGDTLKQLESLFPEALGQNDNPDQVDATGPVFKWESGFDVRTNGGYGVMVDSVHRGSPASRAGLAVNDLILKVNGVSVRDSKSFLKNVEQSDGSVNILTFQYLSGDLVELRFNLTRVSTERPKPALTDQRFVVFQNKLKVDEVFFQAATANYGGTWLRHDFTNRMFQNPVDWNGKSFTANETLKREIQKSDPSTRLLILSEVALKSKWQGDYHEIDPQDFTFELPNGTKKQIPAFGAKRRAYFLKTDQWEMMELPLLEKGLSMFFILPGGRDTKSHIAALDDSLAARTERMDSTELELEVPKFKFNSEISLRPTLEKLGVLDVFSDRADLGLISPDTDLKIQSVIQSTEIACDHIGVSAQGVTVIRAILKYSPERKFSINRPFFFIITRRDKGEILFAGRVLKP